MARTSRKDLDHCAHLINKALGLPVECWRKDADGVDRMNVGHMSINAVYGGFSLAQIANEQGGERDVLGKGHIQAKLLYAMLQALIQGIELAQEGR